MEAARNILQDVQSLADQLVAEPFCVQYSLAEQPLGKVKQMLSNAEVGRMVPPQSKESFHRFKATFDLLLMQLEQSGTDESTLGMCSLSTYSSHVTIQPMIDLEMPSADEPMAFNEKSEVTMMGNITNYVASKTKPRTPAPAPVAPLPVAEAQGPSEALAKEYFGMAGYFRSARATPSESLSPAHLIRLEAQQICFALEAEFQPKVSAFLSGIWEQRKALLGGFLNPMSETWDFHPALIRAWEKQSPTEKLPLFTFRNSIKFLASAPDGQVMGASLLEAGLWVYLFGQDTNLEGLALQNRMRLPVAPETVSDTFLRLCRVFRIRTLLMNPASPFSSALLDELATHAAELFRISRTWPKSG